MLQNNAIRFFKLHLKNGALVTIQSVLDESFLIIPLRNTSFGLRSHKKTLKMWKATITLKHKKLYLIICLLTNFWRQHQTPLKFAKNAILQPYDENSTFSSFHVLPEFLPPRSGSLSIYLRYTFPLCIQILALEEFLGQFTNSPTEKLSNFNFDFSAFQGTGVLFVFQCTKKMKVNQKRETLYWKFYNLTTNTMSKGELNTMNYWIKKIMVLFM